MASKKKTSTGERLRKRINEASRISGMSLRQLYEAAAHARSIKDSQAAADFAAHFHATTIGKEPDPPNYFRTYVNSVRKVSRRRVERAAQLSRAA